MDSPISSPVTDPKEVRLDAKMPSYNELQEHGADPLPPVATMTKARIVRNLLLLNVPNFLLLSSFWSLAVLESTMNAQGGMGPVSQAAIYLCAMVSCFLPELLIAKFGCKTTYAVSLLLFCPFIASNFHLRWDAVMATSILAGLCFGPLNTAITLYLDEMAVRYVALTGANAEGVKAFVFGFFMVFSEATQVFGNGVSYYVLGRGKHPPPLNGSLTSDCGVGFDPASNVNNTNLTPPSDHERVVLTGAFLAMSVLAVVAALFLDPLNNDIKPVTGCNLAGQKLTSAAKRLKNAHQLLLLPLTAYCGVQSAFYINVFTQAFIACSWGVHHVGFVTICFGVCGALMSVLVGPLVKLISQMSVIILAAIINITTIAMLFVWQPSPESPALYFVFAGLFGVTDAIWWSQIAALYGLMFPNNREAAFSNFFFWGFFGYFISYSYANYLTVAVKIYIMLAFLVVGIVLFVVGQVKIKCAARADGYTAVVEAD